MKSQGKDHRENKQSARVGDISHGYLPALAEVPEVSHSFLQIPAS